MWFQCDAESGKGTSPQHFPELFLSKRDEPPFHNCMKMLQPRTTALSDMQPAASLSKTRPHRLPAICTNWLFYHRRWMKPTWRPYRIYSTGPVVTGSCVHLGICNNRASMDRFIHCTPVGRLRFNPAKSDVHSQCCVSNSIPEWPFTRTRRYVSV